jgi:hypothetical protein
VGAGNLTPVAVDVVYERFPASVRGALVVRGRDGDPHQVVLAAADLREAAAPSRRAQPLGLGAVTVDIVPRGEVLIPFEVPFAGLDPGWYGVSAEVLVDGQVRVRGPEEPLRPFVVRWPSGSVRRGSIELGLRIKVPGTGGATIERVDCRMESAVVHWRHAPGDDAGAREFDELRVSAGRRRLPVVTDVFEHGSGERTTTVYPVLKADARLTFALDRRSRARGAARGGPWSAQADLPR